MTDDEAKSLLYDWYGFYKEKVNIIRSIYKREINRHGQLRIVGETERTPIYNSPDWNYIKFNCGGRSYEVYNDELRFYE